MKLGIGERLTLLGVLPQEGNFATLKIVRKLQEELSFDDTEFKKYDIEQNGGNIKWNNVKDKAEQKDVKVGEKAHDIIREELIKLDKEQKMKPYHIILYEKFVETKVEE